MTGFGTGDAPLGDGLLRMELRAVNHRHLDLRVRAPDELSEIGHLVEDWLRGRLGRGRVEAQLRWDTSKQHHAALDMGAARAAYAALCALRDELTPGELVPLTAVLRVPGVFTSTARAERIALEAAALTATQQALTALEAMRAREGAALQRDLLARLHLVRAQVAHIEAERPRVLSEQRERMLARVRKLLDGSDLPVDPARLAQEVAWFAERSDVTEETTRLSSHLAEFERTLRTCGQMVGRKLDFLVQELGREINTVGSKANDAALGQRVVEIKAELERIREQVQNIL
jgi:uncharacterized protein (TIGR00255 family)